MLCTLLIQSYKAQTTDALFDPLEDEDEVLAKHLPKCYPYGSLLVDDLVQRLAQTGLTDAKVEEDQSGYIVTLANEDMVIQVKDTSTHIISNNSKLREKLRDILLDCLNSF
ncbi:integrator complex subunit 9-like [Oratosquilla oratoria]|uniref:integrator complex subunit 9-like n=1 Tax=Oratosquilla oratoria TaxID=337810 RepID=UPI003F760102